MLTIGYGDEEIRNRPFQCFYILLGAGVGMAFFAIFSANAMEQEEAFARRRLAALTKYLAETVLRRPSSGASAQQASLAPLVVPRLRDKSHAEENAEGGAANESNDTTMHALHAAKALSLGSLDAELRQLQHSALVHTLHILLVMLLGAAIMGGIENWSYSDGLYWAISTICSVGYGDISAHTVGGKVFTIFFAPLGCGICMKGFGEMVRFPLILRQKQNEARVLQQFQVGLSERALERILSSSALRAVPRLQKSPTALDKSEFLLSLLLMMGRISEADMSLAGSIFDSLDGAECGLLSLDRLRQELRLARLREGEAEGREREEGGGLVGNFQHVYSVGGILAAGVGGMLVESVGGMLGLHSRGETEGGAALGLGQARLARRSQSPATDSMTGTRGPDVFNPLGDEQSSALDQV